MSLSLHESVSLITSFPSEIETRCHKVMFHTKSPSLHFSIHKFSYFYKLWTLDSGQKASLKAGIDNS